MLKRARRERGMIYVLSMTITIFLTVAGASMLLRAVSENGLSSRSSSQAEALHLADAGIDQASINLRTPTDLTDDVNAVTLPTGGFTIDSPAEQISAFIWKVTAHGASAGDADHPANVEAVFQLTPKSVFQFAMFGDQQINVSGNATTDSFNSSLGAYGGANVSHQGDIGTNTTTAGGVTVGGSIFVDGQVAVGPGVADPASVVTGYDPAFITGSPDVVSQSLPFPMPAVTVPGGLTCTDYTVSDNSTVTLPPGVYCYNNLTVQGGGTLTASGPVTVYLTGALVAQGNSTVGVVDNPPQMIFKMTATSDATLESGTITGSTAFYGALYGPDATIDISGNAKIFGSIIAGQVNMTGSAEIHYDAALADNTTVSNVYETALRYWKKL